MRTYQVTYYDENRDFIKTCFFNAVNDTAAHKLAFAVIPRGTEYVGLALITKDSFLFSASHKKVPTLISEQRMRENKMKKRHSDTENLRLDSCCSNEESSGDLHEVIADSYSDFAEDVVSALYWQRIICRMPEGDQKIIKRLVDGMTVGEIAKEDKISRQAVHRKLQRIRTRLQGRV